MEWFSQKTSIAGYQIPNWALVLGVIIVLFIIYKFSTFPSVSGAGIQFSAKPWRNARTSR